MLKPIISDLLLKNASLGAGGDTPGGLHYVYSVESDTDTPTGMFTIALPFVTDTHVVGIPKSKDTLASLSSIKDTLQPLHLEGDYNTYFSVYVANDQQVESRVLLDPEAMAYSIDFCSAYVWEIVNSTLYFANEGPLPDLRVVDEFVSQITPASAVSAAIRIVEQAQMIEQLSPTETKLLCPVCSIPLRKGRRWLACSEGHGYLLKTAELIATRQHRNDLARAVKQSVGARPSVITPVTIVEHGDLHCPNDGQLLKKAPYQESTAFLYTCGSCIYRWIDAKDLDTVLGAYRNDGEDEENDNDTDSIVGSIGKTLMHDVEQQY